MAQIMRERGAEAYDTLLDSGQDIAVMYLPDGIVAQCSDDRHNFVSGLVAAAIPTTPRIAVFSETNQRGILRDSLALVALLHPVTYVHQNDEYCQFSLSSRDDEDAVEHTLLSLDSSVKNTRGISADLLVTVGSSRYSNSHEFQQVMLNGISPVLRMKNVKWVHVTTRPRTANTDSCLC